MAPTNGPLLRFSNFEVDLRAGELRKHGLKIKLQDQPFQVLISLMEKPGEIVSREELRERLWPADTFVDFDHSLNSAVKKLRQALNDDPDVPRFIETLPRRGYRFIAPVLNAAANAAEGFELLASQARASALPDSPPQPHHWKLWAAGGCGFVIALILAAWIGLPGSRSKSAPEPMKLVPLTTYSNDISKPTFSPDGNQIAFAWEGDKQNSVDIYIKQIGTEKPLQITQDFGYNFSPAWSPDGRYLAFLHATRSEDSGIYFVPALGGPPRKLIDIQHGRDCKPVLSWSPDGRFLTFSDKPSLDVPCNVQRVRLEDLQVTNLTNPPVPSTGDWDAEYSLDGKNIAFIRNTKDVDDIFIMPASGGEPRRVTFDGRLIAGLAWTTDGNELVFSSNRGGATWGLWRVPAHGGIPQRVGVGSEHAYMPVVSPKGNRLAYALGFWNENIWRVPIEPGHRAGKAEKWIYSNMQEEGPQYSPDGKHIVFQSTRSGSFEIWRADADGKNLVQLTSFGGPLTGTPRWSPDGKQISFDSRPGQHANIHLVHADGGPVHRFVNDTSDDGVASWSHDGKWLYFASNRTGGWQVWKRTVDGGQPIQVTKNGGFAALESSDGKVLYYTKFSDPGIWSVPVQGGPETKVADAPPQGFWGYFALAPDGIYFCAEGENHKAVLKFLSLATHKLVTVAEMEKDPYFGAPGMSVSPDGRYILVVRLDEARNSLMLAENFR